MPAITSGKVLVTGANGFIAVWVVKKLLENGYSVRGTVRSESKGKHLEEIFKEYGDKFEIVVVEDITKVRLTSSYTQFLTRFDVICVGGRVRRSRQRCRRHRAHRITLPFPRG